MDPLDLQLLSILEKGLPIVSEPYEEIGKKLNLTGKDVIDRIRQLHDRGVIRKFRARINQRKVGITANALVAWKPANDEKADIGLLLPLFPCVTHCYERLPVADKWEYTYYTVHHGYTMKTVIGEIGMIADKIGVNDYIVLFSTKEFKRVPNIRINGDGGQIR